MSLEIIFCKECQYWRDRLVKQKDGRLRQYKESDRDPLFNMLLVSNEVEINIGAICTYDIERGCKDNVSFRNEDDFCSKARKRPCSYEQWYGIVDGFYPEKVNSHE
jgi:hypothetical protein